MTVLEQLLGRYISLRQHSEQEVRRYLERKRKKISVTDAFVEELIEKYKRLGYINDTAFCESLTHHVIQTKGRGKSILRMKLLQAGVPAETITHALSSIPTEDLQSAMEKRLSKNERKLATLAPKERYAKAYSILFASGFSSGEIRPFLDEWTEKR